MHLSDPRALPGDKHGGCLWRKRQSSSSRRMRQHSLLSQNAQFECGQVHHPMEESAHFQLFADAATINSLSHLDSLWSEHSNGLKKYSAQVQMHSFYLGGCELLSQDQKWHSILSTEPLWSILQLFSKKWSIFGLPQHEIGCEPAWRQSS